MNNSFAIRYFLLIILSVNIITPADGQKESKEFPKAKVMTGEELQRMENERKRNEEFQKIQEAEQAAWAKKYRIDEYPNIILNDIFKFGFTITILLAIAICLIKKRPRVLEYYLPSLILISLYALHCTLYSHQDEFGDCFLSGIKIALISTLLSSILVLVFTTIFHNTQKLSKDQKTFAIVILLVLTAFISYILTSNIESNDSRKPLLVLYPWNWLSFLIINGVLFYYLKIIKSNKP